MIKIKNLTLRNFMSTGNVTQSINLDRHDLTLVLGENLEAGGNGSRNGCGKCVGTNTVVKVRDTLTGQIYEITIGDLYNSASEQQSTDN
jgi:hypothetical protein